MRAILILFFICSLCLAQPKDSTQYKKLQEQLKNLENAFNKRVEELINQDPMCNQYRGAITVIQALIEEEKRRLSEGNKK